MQVPEAPRSPRGSAAGGRRQDLQVKDQGERAPLRHQLKVTASRKKLEGGSDTEDEADVGFSSEEEADGLPHVKGRARRRAVIYGMPRGTEPPYVARPVGEAERDQATGAAIGRPVRSPRAAQLREDPAGRSPPTKAARVGAQAERPPVPVEAIVNIRPAGAEAVGEAGAEAVQQPVLPADEEGEDQAVGGAPAAAVDEQAGARVVVRRDQVVVSKDFMRQMGEEMLRLAGEGGDGGRPAGREEGRVALPARVLDVGEDERKCPVCNREFPDNDALKAHLPVHTGERRVECPKCKRQFASEKTLGVHKKGCGKEGEHECEACGKRYKSKGALTQHAKAHVAGAPEAHVDEGELKCQFCGKADYTKRKSLKEHEDECLQNPESGAPYECLFGCMRKFNRKKNRQQHHSSQHGYNPRKK